jgi:hypothetical protein
MGREVLPFLMNHFTWHLLRRDARISLNGNDTSGLDAVGKDGDMYRMLSAAES